MLPTLRTTFEESLKNVCAGHIKVLGGPDSAQNKSRAFQEKGPSKVKK